MIALETLHEIISFLNLTICAEKVILFTYQLVCFPSCLSVLVQLVSFPRSHLSAKIFPRGGAERKNFRHEIENMGRKPAGQTLKGMMGNGPSGM